MNPAKNGRRHGALLTLAITICFWASGLADPAKGLSASAVKSPPTQTCKSQANISAPVLTAQQAPPKPRKDQARKAQGASKKKGGSPAAAKKPEPWPDNVLALAGQGAVLVYDPQKPEAAAELFSHNAGRQYVPASILKVLTSAAALDILGPDYRFTTEFALTSPGPDLWIIGRGDPALTSEELAVIAAELKRRGLAAVRNIEVDAHYFDPDLVLDGNSQSQNPYDAFNGAICVNFNTIYCEVTPKGQVSSAESHTPLTPLAKAAALKSGQKGRFRLNLSDNPAQTRLYAGELFQAFLEQAGITVSGTIRTEGRAPKKRTGLYWHQSRLPLQEMIQSLLEYSNNFMTNQIFLTLGVESYGPPATLEKAQRAVKRYLDRQGLDSFPFQEGSGLSRQNKLTARQMIKVLKEFEPYRRLMTASSDQKVWYKTGTMSDVKTLAGYLERPGERPLYFVVLLNGSYGPNVRNQILDLLKAEFTPQESLGHD